MINPYPFCALKNFTTPRAMSVRNSQFTHRVACRFDLASTAANITTTPAGSVALFAVTDCDAFATATADGAGRCPLASAFRTQNSIWHQLPPCP
jgi:hypothetical protein